VDWSAQLNGLSPEHFNSIQKEAIILSQQEMTKLQTSIAAVKEEVVGLEKVISEFRGTVASQEELLKQAG
jgi:hypothetical protein